MKQRSVLVVDDERRYRDLLEMDLQRWGYRVLLAGDGLHALELAEQGTPDLVLLDMRLPDMDGYEVCRRIRELSSVPIIMLTARADDADKVRGLRTGADDYVTKPFSAEELRARIEAVFRRSEVVRPPDPRPFEVGELRVDFAHHQVTLRGRDVDLTPTEYRLLEQLAANAGRVMIQDELLRRVWGPGYDGATELLHAAIRRLRLRIEEDPASPRYIHTKRGIGYLLDTSPAT